MSASSNTVPHPAALKLSVIVPVRNEEGNIANLLAEIAHACEAEHPGAYEILYVDDGSTDETATILLNLCASYPALRVLRHTRSGGQSAAIRTGVFAARGEIIATLDGDGQNNPAFLPAMVQLVGGGVGLVQGQRVGRKDTRFKRWQSRIANGIRGVILQDGTRDTGCGLKVFPRHVYLALPYFDALHRFMPALVKRAGYKIAHCDVVDRPRGTGVSNYGFWGRLSVGLMDMMGVWWLIRRCKPAPDVKEIAGC